MAAPCSRLDQVGAFALERNWLDCLDWILVCLGFRSCLLAFELAALLLSVTLVTTVITLLLCRRCGIDTDSALARGHRREVEGVLVRQLVEVHLRVDEVLVVDVLGDHTLHVAMLVLEALECTLHHEVLDGNSRVVDLSYGLQKVDLPLPLPWFLYCQN